MQVTNLAHCAPPQGVTTRRGTNLLQIVDQPQYWVRFFHPPQQ